MEIIGETILKWFITFILGSIIGIIGTKLKSETKKNKALKKCSTSIIKKRIDKKIQRI